MEAEEGESELGRLQHWEEAYEQELENFNEHGDEGEVWFGENVLQTMCDWLSQLLEARLGLQSAKAAAIIDIGTGNGTLLLQLARDGYNNLAGVDYSKKSIQLAEAILQHHGKTNISLAVDDICDTRLTARYAVATDKGTYDAIGLSEGGLTSRRLYQKNVWKLLVAGGLLVITSCNYTVAELKEEFCRQDSGCIFQYVDHVKIYPVLKFGGIEGTRVCTVAFSRVESIL